MIQDVTTALQDRTIEAAKHRPKEQNLRKLDEIARQFESVFLQMMMKSMRSTIKKSGFMDGGRAEETFTGLLDLQITENASKNRRNGIGIADMIRKHYGKYVKADPQPPKLDTKG
jgi:peptidoglycan hydrolase FlgJ